MPETEIKELLGDPDYCPNEDVFYYSSDKHVRVTEGEPLFFTYTLVITFKKVEETGNRAIESWFLEPIGE